MSGPCCGGSSSPEAKTAVAAEPQRAKAVAEQEGTKSNKSECCNDKPAKSEKQGCGC